VAGQRDRKGARVEIRVSSAELRVWRRTARAHRVSLAAAARVAMSDLAAKPRVVLRKHVLPKATRREAREGSTRLGKGK